MNRSTTTIPFHDLTFVDDIPKLRNVEDRLHKFLRGLRRERQDRDHEAGKISEDDLVNPYTLVEDQDRARIKRRAARYVERVQSSTGLYHLSEEARARLTPLRGGLPVTRIVTEHEADEIAAALHAEMPWMARATEEVWHGLRASARDGLPGVRFAPLVLNGAPGIGKSYWARRLAHHLAVPTTKIEATGEPATFSLVGLQKGWGSASPGKLMQTVLSARHAGPLVIVDEIEKSGEMHSNKGVRHTLTDALLPLLERMTAAQWECPFFQIKCDMSWVNWVMTANSRKGLPEPLQSRCVVLDLPDLTRDQLRDFTLAEGARRGLPEPAIAAIGDLFDGGAIANARLSLRTVCRMLERAEALARKPMLN
ncbi:AAA family ATPase [Ruegeria sp. HKCCA4008]|uniref:AAA family ATPase n=1 Tax=Ruegeria sp. HKCCA4008 TaxID=2682999 RepID=UPI00148962BE|nr:AAA family ATPase [Ruegeria sp. HKCCA4008]